MAVANAISSSISWHGEFSNLAICTLNRLLNGAMRDCHKGQVSRSHFQSLETVGITAPAVIKGRKLRVAWTLASSRRPHIDDVLLEGGRFFNLDGLACGHSLECPGLEQPRATCAGGGAGSGRSS
mmetsp:Transcript_18054/g.37604  ORF Transcript_18054/g.37604 Transcript_18054/m.37604 type:complete len:125 (+) Transcript_18054:411-785(+)